MQIMSADFIQSVAIFSVKPRFIMDTWSPSFVESFDSTDGH